MSGLTTKGHKETFWGDGNILLSSVRCLLHRETNCPVLSGDKGLPETWDFQISNRDSPRKTGTGWSPYIGACKHLSQLVEFLHACPRACTLKICASYYVLIIQLKEKSI